MYPTVVSEAVVLTGTTLRKTFFGFCVLSILLAGYFLDRQLTIRQLRKRFFEEQRRVMTLGHEASAELLESLPGFGHFQDRIAMEFRRASNTQEPLSLLVVQLRPARELSEPVEITSAFGDGAKALTHTLRREDSICQIRPGVFEILLPGVSAADACRVSDRIADRLRAASGASECFSFDIRVVNYPEHIATAREMERAVVSFLPENQPDQHAA
jgi:GGDEF domain-containing protein